MISGQLPSHSVFVCVFITIYLSYPCGKLFIFVIMQTACTGGHESFLSHLVFIIAGCSYLDLFTLQFIVLILYLYSI